MTEVQPNDMDIECLLCKKGFFKVKNDYTSCQPCTRCANHLKVKVPCDDDSDTICSNNECEDGFEFDLNLNDCVSNTPLVARLPIQEPTTQDPSIILKECDRSVLDKLNKVLNTVHSLQALLKKEKEASPVMFNGCKCELNKLNRVLDKFNFLICMLSFTASFSVAIFVLVVYLGVSMRKASLI